MRRYGINLNALRAFEAAARLSSFSQAGTELHVSHSTISHHIKKLEQELGVELFVRKNRRVTLTSDAEKLFRVLNRSFDDISASLAEIANDKLTAPLRVTVTPSFANKWLIPNLRKFRDAHPGIEVLVKPSLKLDDFSKEKLDVGVRTGLGNWPGLDARLLMSVNMAPVCSPEYLQRCGSSITLDRIHQHALIHADVVPGTGIVSEWTEWLSQVDAPDFDSRDNLSVQDPGLALQAAKDGLGIAMGYLELASIDLAKGVLVQLFSTSVKHPWSYYIVTPEDNIGDARVTTFSKWLHTEVAKHQ